jgi:hypothetical protein
MFTKLYLRFFHVPEEGPRRIKSNCSKVLSKICVSNLIKIRSGACRRRVEWVWYSHSTFILYTSHNMHKKKCKMIVRNQINRLIPIYFFRKDRTLSVKETCEPFWWKCISTTNPVLISLIVFRYFRLQFKEYKIKEYALKTLPCY